MKWIGQHIWDFISRFRNDVYIENLTEQEEEFSVMVGPDGKLYKSTHPGERSRIQVRNDEGATIPAGAPLYSKGEIGGSERILVGICDSSDTAKMPCIGIAQEEMNTTSTKDNFAITQGIYNTNISGFTGLSVGDNLYVNGGSAPHLTQTKPTNGDLIQNVGIVLKTNGTICQGLLVSAIGRTNDVPWPLYVDHTNQRVGVGTASPSNRLDVQDTTSTYVARFRGASATYVQSGENTLSGETGFLAKNSTGALFMAVDSGVAFLTGTSGANTMAFGVGGSEKMRLTSGGNVLIGTTTDSGDKLQVTGNDNVFAARLNGGTTGGQSYGLRIRAGTNSVDKSFLIENTGGTDLFTVSGDGSTTLTETLTGPSGTFGTLKVTTGLGSAAELQFTNAGAGLYRDSGNLVLAGYDNIVFKSSNDVMSSQSERMRLTSGGNLLIGTTSDNGNKLQIETSNNNDGFRLNYPSNNSTQYPFYIGKSDDSNYIRVNANIIAFKRNGAKSTIKTEGSNNNLTLQSQRHLIFNTSDANERARITSDGNLLLGTTTDSGAKLNVQGSLQVGVDDTGYDVTFYGATSGRYLLWDESANALRFQDNTFIKLGTGDDLNIYHDGSNAIIYNSYGDFNLSQTASGKDIILKCDNGAGGTTAYITLDGSQQTINLQKTVLIGTTTNTGAYKIDVAGKQRVQDTLELDDVLMLNAISTPSDPAAGKSVIYMDSSDGGIKCKINVGGTVVTRTLASFE